MLGLMENPNSDNASGEDSRFLRKTQSHGRIGEAAVTAKCWMNGVAAYNTGGLRANFAGSDLIIDTADPKVKKLVQVKTGYRPMKEQVYLTQCGGDADLRGEKFVADFIVFVNIEKKVGRTHKHNGELGFEHLAFYVVPRDDANKIYQSAVQRQYEKPLRNGGLRKLGNMAVTVGEKEMEPYFNGWKFMRQSNEKEPR